MILAKQTVHHNANRFIRIWSTISKFKVCHYLLLALFSVPCISLPSWCMNSISDSIYFEYTDRYRAFCYRIVVYVACCRALIRCDRTRLPFATWYALNVSVLFAPCFDRLKRIKSHTLNTLISFELWTYRFNKFAHLFSSFNL